MKTIVPGHYAREDNRFWPAKPYTPDHDHLPGGTYVLKHHSERGWYFEVIDDFVLPTKMYGDIFANRDRIISTFMDRPFSTGVMLAGEKGSGKTLLAKAIAIALRKQDIPTIVVNTAFVGDGFATLIQNIHQPALFMFDEFEKVYDKETQEGLLTLLDGVYPSKKMFMLTTNDKWRIDDHMKNRPGRIYYLLSFDGLDPAFIREYIEDNLKNADHIDEAVLTASMFNRMNFDMLKALVEEMNRYNESARAAIRLLNVNPEFDGNATYKFKFAIGGVEFPNHALPYGSWDGNPLLDGIVFPYYALHSEDEGVTGFHDFDNSGEGQFHQNRLSTEDRRKYAAFRKREKGDKVISLAGIQFSVGDVKTANQDGIVFENEYGSLTLLRQYSSRSSYRDYDY